MDVSINIIYDNSRLEELAECLRLLPKDCEFVLVDTEPLEVPQGLEQYLNPELTERTEIIDNKDNRIIAKYYYKKPFPYGRVRNYAKSLSTRSWIFSIDTDELFNPMQEYMLRDLNKLKPEITGVAIYIFSWLRGLIKEDNFTRFETTRAIRIFRNIPEIKWTENPVHESVQDSITGCTDIGLLLIHEGYNIPKESMIAKMTQRIDSILENSDCLRKKYMRDYLIRECNTLEMYEGSNI